jgi:16S rRNA (cytosine967-C5)-methyltransferase
VLRVETGRISPRDLLRALEDESVAATAHPLLRSALKVDQVGALLRSHAFAKGHCYVQDVASQLLLTWMAPLFRGRVLDACAAPGGKLTWLAGLRAEGLWPLGAELSAERLGLVRENFARLRLPPVPLLRADGGRLPIKPNSLDGLLLDVPCSATGMIRKYPELKWRKRESDLAGYTSLQARLLDEGAPTVKAGAWLLYITCSLEPEENEQQVEAFLKRHEHFRRRSFFTLTVPKALGEPERQFITRAGDFQVLPADDRMGLYAALLEKVQPAGDSAAGTEPAP